MTNGRPKANDMKSAIHKSMKRSIAPPDPYEKVRDQHTDCKSGSADAGEAMKQSPKTPA
jgi:hypothetical protein